MPSNIILADAASPAVNHTFVPVRDGTDSLFVNESSQTLAGQESLALQVVRSVGGKQAHTVTQKIWDPVEATVDGTVVVAYGSSSVCKVNFAPAATLQQRKDLLRLTIAGLEAKFDDIVNLRAQF